jgi:hypothetical protein
MPRDSVSTLETENFKREYPRKQLCLSIFKQPSIFVSTPAFQRPEILQSALLKRRGRSAERRNIFQSSSLARRIAFRRSLHSRIFWLR